MSVIDAQEIWDGREGEDDLKARRYTRVWRVRTDNAFDREPTVLAAVPIQPGDLHPADPGAWCQRAVAANESFNAKTWTCQFFYSSERERQPNPLDDPADISWDTEDRQRPLVVDRNGKVALNSAGDWFDPPIMVDDPRWTALVVKNVPAVPAWALQYRNSINSDTFTLDGISISPGQAKIKSLRITPWQNRNGVAFRTITLPIHLDADGWKVTAVDLGYREKDPDDATKRRHILDDDGTKVTVPVPLNGAGEKLDNPNPLNAVAIEFEHYKELPFASLPLT